MKRQTLVVLWLSLASRMALVDGGKNPCHGKAVHEKKSNCEMVTIPQGFCSTCHINSYKTSGEKQGDFEDCTRTYTIEDSACLAKFGEYVDMNPCDQTRKTSYNKFKNSGSDFDRKVLDYFAYTICENACDCIPKETAFREVPSIDVHRGNCQAHPQFDVCKILPDVRLIRSEGSVDDSASLPKACPLVNAWFKSPFSKSWGSTAFTPVQEDVKYFLNRLMGAGEILTDVTVYQQCYDLERNQSRIDPPPNNPPAPVPPTPTPPTPTPPTPTPPTDTGGGEEQGAIRINAGGGNQIFGGVQWMADDYYTGGKLATPSKEKITNTNADALYHSERWGEFTYDIPVANGKYNVILHFAEVFDKNLKSNVRVFDVSVEEGAATFTNVDIFAAKGGFAAYFLNANNIPVSDGKLTIDFVKGAEKKDNPKVSAIEVIPMSSEESGNESGPSPTPPNKDPSTTAAPQTAAPVPPPSLQQGGAFSPNAILRINAGPATGKFTFGGLDWVGDDGYLDGGTKAAFDVVPITGTDADELYLTERWGPCTFKIPVDNGEYSVVMHFAEVLPSNQAPGQRVFNIDIENGQKTFTGVDIFVSANGGYKPYSLTANVMVSDGELTVAFTKGASKNPKISGLEVIPIESSPTPSPLPLDGLAVTKLVLIDADSDSDLFDLGQNTPIVLSNLPSTNLNIRADVVGNVNSVKFTGTLGSKTESVAPYAFAGDDFGDYKPFNFGLGTYTMTATPYTQAFANGSPGAAKTVSFTVS